MWSRYTRQTRQKKKKKKTSRNHEVGQEQAQSKSREVVDFDILWAYLRFTPQRGRNTRPARKTNPASSVESIQVLMSCWEVTLTPASMWLSVRHDASRASSLCVKINQFHLRATAALVNSLWSHMYEETGFFFLSSCCTHCMAVIVPIVAWFKSKHREIYYARTRCWILHLQPNQSWIIEYSNSKQPFCSKYFKWMWAGRRERQSNDVC